MGKIPSIDTLRKEKSTKDSEKVEIFNIVLNKCVEKILYANRHTDKTFVIFEVPQILIGYPMYDMKSCILFVMNKLAQSNYLVEFIEPFYLYIDWGSKQHRAPSRSLTRPFPMMEGVEFVYEDLLKKSKKSKNGRK